MQGASGSQERLWLSLSRCLGLLDKGLRLRLRLTDAVRERNGDMEDGVFGEVLRRWRDGKTVVVYGKEGEEGAYS